MKIFPFRRETLLAALAFAAYVAATINDFHTDDWLVLNILRDGLAWRDFLSMENYARFRPLTNIILYLRYLSFGEFAAAYYVLNILFHAAFCILLYRFLLRIKINESPAFYSAAIFAVFFPHYEAVLWPYGTIRIFAAIFWIGSLRALYIYLENGNFKNLAAFAVISFLGFFIVEDMVVAPLGYAVFTVIFAQKNLLRRRLWPVIISAIAGLTVYFVLRSILISRPGIVEEYYYFGFHIFSRLLAYLQWMILPPPDHPYFLKLSAALGQKITWLWNSASVMAVLASLAAMVYALFRADKAVRFFILFIFIALIPAMPLNYKVTSRNIYLPSIGLAVLAGFLVDKLIRSAKSGSFIRKTVYVSIAGYAIMNIAAIWITSFEYRKTQSIVAGMIADLNGSGAAFNSYPFILLDNMPGRAVVGPAMIYRLRFANQVIASNDPTYGPIDIRAAIQDLTAKHIPFMVFDYRNGHLVDATVEYLSQANGIRALPEITPDK